MGFVIGVLLEPGSDCGPGAINIRRALRVKVWNGTSNAVLLLFVVAVVGDEGGKMGAPLKSADGELGALLRSEDVAGEGGGMEGLPESVGDSRPSSPSLR